MRKGERARYSTIHFTHIQLTGECGFRGAVATGFLMLYLTSKHIQTIIRPDSIRPAPLRQATWTNHIEERKLERSSQCRSRDCPGFLVALWAYFLPSSKLTSLVQSLGIGQREASSVTLEENSQKHDSKVRVITL